MYPLYCEILQCRLVWVKINTIFTKDTETQQVQYFYFPSVCTKEQPSSSRTCRVPVLASQYDLRPLIPCVCAHLCVVCMCVYPPSASFPSMVTMRQSCRSGALWWKLMSDSQGQKRGDSWACQHPEQEQQEEQPGAWGGDEGSREERREDPPQHEERNVTKYIYSRTYLSMNLRYLSVFCSCHRLLWLHCTSEGKVLFTTFMENYINNIIHCLFVCLQNKTKIQTLSVN